MAAALSFALEARLTSFAEAAQDKPDNDLSESARSYREFSRSRIRVVSNLSLANHNPVRDCRMRLEIIVCTP